MGRERLASLYVKAADSIRSGEIPCPLNNAGNPPASVTLQNAPTTEAASVKQFSGVSRQILHKLPHEFLQLAVFAGP